MLVLVVVNNSLTPSLRNDLQLEGTRPCGYYALISSSPVPLPRREGSSSLLPWIRQAVLLLIGAGRPWTMILWEKSHAAPTSSPPQDSVLPAPTFSRRCLNGLGKRPMLVGIPCILEEKVLLWDNPSNSPPLPGHCCTLTLLELPMLRGSRFCPMSR